MTHSSKRFSHRKKYPFCSNSSCKWFQPRTRVKLPY